MFRRSLATEHHTEGKKKMHIGVSEFSSAHVPNGGVAELCWNGTGVTD